jgi:hypothetical protein
MLGLNSRVTLHDRARVGRGAKRLKLLGSSVWSNSIPVPRETFRLGNPPKVESIVYLWNHFPIFWRKCLFPTGQGLGRNKPHALRFAVNLSTKYLLIQFTSGVNTCYPGWSNPLWHNEYHEIFPVGAQWDHQGAFPRCRRASSGRA